MPLPKQRNLFGGGARRWGDTLLARVVVVIVFIGLVILGVISAEFMSALRIIICPGGPLNLLA